MSQSNEPTLKQAYELDRDDFIQFPLWMQAYGIDADKPWYSRVNEATYRPWVDQVPYDVDDPELPLVRARCVLRFADGTLYDGACLVPSPIEPANLQFSYVQPILFAPPMKVRLWRALHPSANERQQFYAAVNKQASEVFPISVLLQPPIVSREIEVSVPGFGAMIDGETSIVL